MEHPPKPSEKFVPVATFPFHFAYPLVAGIVAGLFLRFVFSGRPGTGWSAMAGEFIYLAPMVVGAVTIYVAELRERRSWGYYFWAPFVANGVFVLGTLIIMWEGLICAIIIAPFFALVGALGGLAMGMVCRLTNWPKQMLSALAVLPLALVLRFTKTLT